MIRLEYNYPFLRTVMKDNDQEDNSIQERFSRLESEITQITQKYSTQTPTSPDELLTCFLKLLTLTESAKEFGYAGFLLIIRSHEWLHYIITKYIQKNGSNSLVETLNISVIESLLINIKVSQTLLDNPEKYQNIIECNLDGKSLLTELNTQFLNYFGLYTTLSSQKSFADKTIIYDTITKKSNESIQSMKLTLVERNNNKEIANLLSEKKLDLKKMTALIHEYDIKDDLFDYLNENLVIHRLLQEKKESELIAFFLRFSSHIDINSKDENGNTLFHIIANKGFITMANFIVTNKEKFRTDLNLYAKNNLGKTALDESPNEETNNFFSNLLSKDFSERILLVHPLQINSVLDFLYKTNKENLVSFNGQTGEFDYLKTISNAIIQDDTLLSDDAVIGSHLDLKAEQYTPTFIDRPHIHWWWNGLFHANSGGDWEDSLVAYIEPMKNMKNILGCAPYDTMTMDPHQLSKDSCILVPLDCVEALSKRLVNYEGTIIGFDPLKTTLRLAINEAIETYYPNAFQFLNKNKMDINKLVLSDGKKLDNKSCEQQDYNNRSGFFRTLYIKNNEETLPLMKNANEIQFHAYRWFARGKYVGLHSHSPTDIELNAKLNILKAVSKDPGKIIQHQKYFLGSPGSKSLDTLCSVEAYRVYEKLLKYEGASQYADYLLKKALIADLISVYGPNNLDTEEIKKIIEDNFNLKIEKLNELSNATKLPNDGDLRPYKESLLNNYRQVMMNSYKRVMTRVKEKLDEVSENDNQTSHLGFKPTV